LVTNLRVVRRRAGVDKAPHLVQDEAAGAVHGVDQHAAQPAVAGVVRPAHSSGDNKRGSVTSPTTGAIQS
jgi:hypothetical protein